MPNREFTPGSGNVFADLNLPDADDLLAKAELAAKIIAAIQRRRLTQRQAAAIFGIDQPKVSALKHGKLSGFSIERLIRLLLPLGHDVEITVKPRLRSRAAKFHVTYRILERLLAATIARTSRRMRPSTNLFLSSRRPVDSGPIRLRMTVESKIEPRTNSVDEYTSEPAPGLRRDISNISYASQAPRNRIRLFWPYMFRDLVCLQYTRASLTPWVIASSKLVAWNKTTRSSTRVESGSKCLSRDFGTPSAVVRYSVRTPNQAVAGLRLTSKY